MSLIFKFTALKSTATEEEIEKIADDIPDEEKKIRFFDVFCKLRNDDIEGARGSIEVYLEILFRSRLRVVTS